MTRRLATVLTGLLLTLLILAPAVDFDRRHAGTLRLLPSTTLPAPTEHRLDLDAERRHKDLRRAYHESLHQAGPGVDWRAVESENARRRQEERNALIAAGARDSRWNEIGSRNLAGRMHVAAFSALSDSLYGGSSRGGIWKSDVHGVGWRPLSDNLWGGCHGLAVAGDAGEVITSITDNGGLHYSEDDGLTWQVPAGVPASISSCKRVMRDPALATRVYLLLSGSGGLGLYRSVDGGRSYQQVRDCSAGYGDFWLDRVAGGSLYVQDGTDFLVSSDQGDTWTQLGGLPAASVSGIVLTGSEAGAPTFYIAARYSGNWRLYRSLDGGVTWTYRYGIGDFWQTLCASITDPDLVVFAGVEAWRSTNGGGSFTKVNNWWEYYDDPLNKLHADFPGLDCLWLDGAEVWYAATDGGLYRSDDGLASVTNISLLDLGVSQYYGTLTSANDPDLILAGAQDQGYQRSTGPGRGPERDFEQLISGDYAHLTSSDGTHGIVFSVYPGFVLVQSGELNPQLVGFLDFPADESYLWLPPIVADPTDAREFYFCARHLYHARWLNGDNVVYTPSQQNFTVAGGSYLSAFGFSAIDLDRQVAVVNNGRIWYTDDGGAIWRLSGDTGPQSHYFHGTAIAHSAQDVGRVWIGGSGYSGPGVYRSDDGGATWYAESTGLPATLVYDLAIESPTSDVLYAATESGPYRLDPDTSVWEYIGGATAPLTTYWSVEAVPAAEVIYIGETADGRKTAKVESKRKDIDDQTPLVAKTFDGWREQEGLSW